jgi:hypothetical protein
LQAVLSNEREDAMDRLHLPAAGYEEDFVLWLQHQIGLMREHRVEQLDLDNLLEELEGMVRRDRRELRSRIELIIMHLLKCEYQPRLKSGSWLGTLYGQPLAKLLDESPSLARLVDQFAREQYEAGACRAAHETRLACSTFPPALPYSREQLLDRNFVP